MKMEIWKRGPIGCGVDATETFDNYKGGIYKENIKHPQINHEISVVGWGKDPVTGEEYWIGRNSWGTYWVHCILLRYQEDFQSIFQGEYGFFRIGMYGDNLGIETDCIWATPKL